MSLPDRLKDMKERSRLRRQLLAQQMGIRDDKDLGSVLGTKDEQEIDSHEVLGRRLSNSVVSPTLNSGFVIPVADQNEMSNGEERGVSQKRRIGEEKGKDGKAGGVEEETIYTDSKTFLKGTQSMNPHNDYCQHFVDSGQRPQNFIRDTGIADRFEEYPKLKELIKLKDEIIAQRATAPMYLKCDMDTFDLNELKYKFDVIYVDPPLEEYQRRCPGLTFNWRPWQWEEIMRLEVGQIAAQRSFCFLWCGSMEGLDEGRRCLKAWGFRRCEDICWIKTNRLNPGNTKYMEPESALQHTKEHCLMGIKGTVRRSTDGDFIHANVDLDIIISEEPEYGSMEKPEEIFKIVEHFCLGRRRLIIFGNDHTIRPGWVTVGPDLTSSNYSSEQYNTFFSAGPEDYLVGSTDQIEQLRPKSPPPKKGSGASASGRGGRGRAEGGPLNSSARGGVGPGQRSGRGLRPGYSNR